MDQSPEYGAERYARSRSHGSYISMICVCVVDIHTHGTMDLQIGDLSVIISDIKSLLVTIDSAISDLNHHRSSSEPLPSPPSQ